MKLKKHRDGGATIRLSEVELVRYYNMVNVAMRDLATGPDGSPTPESWIQDQRVQLQQLAIAIGRTDVPHSDDD